MPEDPKKVAQAAFSNGNLYLPLREELGSIYNEELFTELFCEEGQPGGRPWCLALSPVMEFAENLSDRPAAEAVRARLDWKSELSWELAASGFHYAILSEFRSRLIQPEKSQWGLDEILKIFKEKKLIKGRGPQRTDSTQVLATGRALHQLEIVGETLGYSLNVLSLGVPDWLRNRIRPEGVDRYGARIDEYRLPQEPSPREILLKTIGTDGQDLLDLIEKAKNLPWIKESAAIKTRKTVWGQPYLVENGPSRPGEFKEMPPVREWIRAPYDPEAG
jgi:transposase